MGSVSDSAMDNVVEGMRVDCVFDDDDYFRGTVDKGTDCCIDSPRRGFAEKKKKACMSESIVNEV